MQENEESIVLILDGNSEIGAHAAGGNVLRYLIKSRFVFLHAWAICSEINII